MQASYADVTEVRAPGTHTYRDTHSGFGSTHVLCNHHVPKHWQALPTGAPSRKPITPSIGPLVFPYIPLSCFPFLWFLLISCSLSSFLNLHFSSLPTSHLSTLIFLSSHPHTSFPTFLSLSLILCYPRSSHPPFLHFRT